MLSVRDLRITFSTDSGPLRAANGISLDVSENEVLGIVGESGSGKSVTAHAMLGLVPRNASVSGQVMYRGRDLLQMDESEASRLRGARIAIVMQEASSALNPVYTVEHQVAEAMTIHQRHADRHAVRQRVIELLDLVGMADAAQRAASYPHQLSGGMAQRVVLAMALANDPEVLVADEPTAALDVTIQAHVLDVLRRVRARTHTAVVLITHDLGVVAGLADTIAVIYAGRVVECAPVDAIFAAPAHPYTRGLLASLPHPDGTGRPSLPLGLPGSPPSLVHAPSGCAFHPRCARAQIPQPCATLTPALEAVSAHRAATGGVGHRAACHFRDEVAGDAPSAIAEGGATTAPRAPLRSSSSDGAPLLEVRDLVKHFPDRTGIRHRGAREIHAVCGISFGVQRAETYCLVGESGCGKSTTARLVLGLLAATSGRVLLDSGTLFPSNDRRQQGALRRAVQVVFQDPEASLNPRRTIGQSVALPLRVHKVYGAGGAERVGELLELVGLQREDVDRYPHELSGGQRQRACIARALILEPALVVLDEPVSALDASVRAGVLRLLLDLQLRKGTAYLLIAHDLAVVRGIADRVAIMYLGKIVETGDRDAIFERGAHPYTQALLSAIPVPDPTIERGRRRVVLHGDLPSAEKPPSGCRFRTRCWKAQAVCAEHEPALIDRGQGHPVACHFAVPAREDPAMGS